MINKFFNTSSKIIAIFILILMLIFNVRYVIPAIPVISQGFTQDMNTVAGKLTNLEYLASLGDQQPKHVKGKTYPYTRAAFQSQVNKFQQDLNHPVIKPIFNFLNSPVFGY